MRPIASDREYRQRMETIRELKYRMWIIARQTGNLDPAVIRISQEIDEYIVSVQQYWTLHPNVDAQTG